MSLLNDHQNPPGLEDQYILRVPQDVAVRLRRMLRQRGADDETAALTIGQDGRNGRFYLGNDQYHTQVVDLPNVVETVRTTDKVNVYKSGDISRMILVHPHGGRAQMPRVDSEYGAADGVTPPLRDIRRRKHRRMGRFGPQVLSQVEAELNLRAKMIHDHLDIDEEHRVTGLVSDMLGEETMKMLGIDVDAFKRDDRKEKREAEKAAKITSTSSTANGATEEATSTSVLDVDASALAAEVAGSTADYFAQTIGAATGSGGTASTTPMETGDADEKREKKEKRERKRKADEMTGGAANAAEPATKVSAALLPPPSPKAVEKIEKNATKVAEKVVEEKEKEKAEEVRAASSVSAAPSTSTTTSSTATTSKTANFSLNVASDSITAPSPLQFSTDTLRGSSTFTVADVLPTPAPTAATTVTSTNTSATSTSSVPVLPLASAASTPTSTISTSATSTTTAKPIESTASVAHEAATSDKPTETPTPVETTPKEEVPSAEVLEARAKVATLEAKLKELRDALTRAEEKSARAPNPILRKKFEASVTSAKTAVNAADTEYQSALNELKALENK